MSGFDVEEFIVLKCFGPVHAHVLLVVPGLNERFVQRPGHECTVR